MDIEELLIFLNKTIIWGFLLLPNKVTQRDTLTTDVASVPCPTSSFYYVSGVCGQSSQNTAYCGDSAEKPTQAH